MTVLLKTLQEKHKSATFDTDFPFHNTRQFTYCFPSSCPCPQAFPTYTLIALTKSQWRKHFSALWNSIPSCCLKVLPLALLFETTCKLQHMQLPSSHARHTTTQSHFQDTSERSIWQQCVGVFITLKTSAALSSPLCCGQSPASQSGIKEEMEFKHKCNNKNGCKASPRTERRITWSKEGTLPLSYFLSHFK